MRVSRSVSVLALGAMLLGCSESTMIRTYPPGSKLYVNDKFVGLTPVIFKVPRSEFGEDFRVRAEREGYATTDSTLQKRVCGGRIAGAIFTLGIVFIFKGPTCFASPQDFAMAPLPGQGEAAGSREPTVDERLQRIEKMRDKGTITNEEYEHYRAEILKDL